MVQLPLGRSSIPASKCGSGIWVMRLNMVLPGSRCVRCRGRATTLRGANWYKAPDAVDPEIGKKSVIDLVKMPEPERIVWLQAHIWPYLAKSFAAVAAGIRSVDPNARFSTHLSGEAAVLPNF